MKAHINDIQKIYADIPKKWNVNGNLIFNYNLLTDQHFADGWRDVVLPSITELQKYSESYILVDDVVTKEVIDFTEEEKKQYFLNKLVELVNFLDKRILISAVNKEEKDIEYLKSQSGRYLEKYKVAKQYVDSLGVIISDQYWYDQIEKELENTNAIQNQNISISDFMGLIVLYYESGEFRNKMFQTAVEIFRAKTKDFILVHNWQKVNECFTIAQSLPETMDLNDLDNLLTQFDAI